MPYLQNPFISRHPNKGFYEQRTRYENTEIRYNFLIARTEH